MTDYRTYVDKLSGKLLDDAVAYALGWIDYSEDSVEHGEYWHIDPEKAPFGRRIHKDSWSPSTNWSQGGPLMEQEKIAIEPKDGCFGAFYHRYRPFNYCNGNTLLVAVCRIFVLERLEKNIDNFPPTVI